MIYYDSSGLKIVLNICRCTGSVFRRAILIAFPCAAISTIFSYYYPNGSFSFNGDGAGLLYQAESWVGFTSVVGLLIVFRTSQAYSRYWDGCIAVYRMRAEWYDAVAGVVAFTHYSKTAKRDVSDFRQLLVRLLSMLHAAALAELEAGVKADTSKLWAHSYDIVDPAGIDTDSLDTIKKSDSRAELRFVWLQQLIVENIDTGILSVPAPILSRSFQELANGMVAFSDAMRISHLPFPFPYAQACDCILVLHWLLVPIITSQWVTSPAWAATFCFVQVFILWSLNLIAMEIDHPFGKASNDIDGERMQEELNSHLVLLLSSATHRTPTLAEDFVMKPLESLPQTQESMLVTRRAAVGSETQKRPTNMAGVFHYLSDARDPKRLSFTFPRALQQRQNTGGPSDSSTNSPGCSPAASRGVASMGTAANFEIKQSCGTSHTTRRRKSVQHDVTKLAYRIDEMIESQNRLSQNSSENDFQLCMPSGQVSEIGTTSPRVSQHTKFSHLSLPLQGVPEGSEGNSPAGNKHVELIDVAPHSWASESSVDCRIMLHLESEHSNKAKMPFDPRSSHDYVSEDRLMHSLATTSVDL